MKWFKVMKMLGEEIRQSTSSFEGWNYSISFIISQKLQIIFKSNQSHWKANSIIYNFHVYTENKFKTEKGENCEYFQIFLTENRGPIFVEPKLENQLRNRGPILETRRAILSFTAVQKSV
ncbi:hypothetical protein MTR_2g450660 [Medicago truncatula]|uniref:Uncharacterized protein n=1 Tax=Medicago truncatula TaxID=3880 RepID=A0A072V791_MEDTR|nr:hypothetical protein MTR_2g450660 [Medicago truncatula]